MPAFARTIGQLAERACVWEVLARKAGNVCPGREYSDLSVADFLESAASIGPVLAAAPHQSLGVTIRRSIEATRRVVNTNTNLGIVLLLAPLASTPLDRPLRLSETLSRTTVADARDVYAAIRLADPGGLGEAKSQDVRAEPTAPLLDVMSLAQERDQIAAEYVGGFTLVLDQAAPRLANYAAIFENVERAIVETQLAMLAEYEDSLIRRKRGPRDAAAVREAANGILRAGGLHTRAGRHAYLEFDAWLRADNHARNPGTTADLIAAGLFVALRENRIPFDAPFDWTEHPFQIGA